MRIDFDDADVTTRQLINDQNQADLITEDEYNFVSGASWALSYITKVFYNNIDNYINDYDERVRSLKKSIIKTALIDLQTTGYDEINSMMIFFKNRRNKI